MSDRELLEAAARAAGMETRWDQPRGSTHGVIRARFPGSGDAFPVWSPLTDDGDALRLAVKLRLAVDCMNNGNVFVGYGPCQKDRLQRTHEVSEFSGAECDTRRAIVRAAAALAVSEQSPQAAP